MQTNLIKKYLDDGGLAGYGKLVAHSSFRDQRELLRAVLRSPTPLEHSWEWRNPRQRHICGGVPSPRRDSQPDTTAATGRTIAISSHEANGTTRNAKAGLGLGGPKAAFP